MRVKQPRAINDRGDYVGLRAIRVVSTLFFEFLGLGPMLQRERARATEELQRRARKAQRKLTDFMRRVTKGFCNSFGGKPHPSRADQEKRMEAARRWNMTCAKYMLADLAPDECRRRTNTDFGLPADEPTQTSDCPPTTAPADVHNRACESGLMPFFRISGLSWPCRPHQNRIYRP